MRTRGTEIRTWLPKPQAATLIVAAANSLYPERADYHCDGVADNVEINAALAALPAAGGQVVLLEGNYTTAANIVVPANATLSGQGFSTIIIPTGAAITNGIVLNGNNITLRDMKVALAAGAGAPGTRPNVIYANTKTLLWMENLWLVGDITVGSDGSNVRQDGVCFVTCTESKIVDCRSEDNYYHGIYLGAGSNNNTIVGNTCQGSDSNDGIHLDASLNNTITGNICQGNIWGYGIALLAGSNNNTITGNTCQGNYDGIILDTSLNNTITGNTCQDNDSMGIWLTAASHNTVSGNTCQSNTTEGIRVSDASLNNTITGNTCQGNSRGIVINTSSYNTITGNTCQGNTDHGIQVYRASYCVVTGNTCRGNGTDGIYVFGDGTANADYNTLMDNICTGNTDDGIEIAGGANANKNVVVGNLLSGNTGTSLVDGGTLTNVDGSNYGIEITQINVYRYVKNTSGVQRVAGEVVILKAVAAGNEITTTVTLGDDKVYGMVAETIADTAYGHVQVKGKTVALKVSGETAIVIGDPLSTHNAAGIAQKAGAGDQAFAIALEAYAVADHNGVIDAYIKSPWD